MQYLYWHFSQKLWFIICLNSPIGLWQSMFLFLLKSHWVKKSFDWHIPPPPTHKSLLSLTTSPFFDKSFLHGNALEATSAIKAAGLRQLVQLVNTGPEIQLSRVQNPLGHKKNLKFSDFFFFLKCWSPHCRSVCPAPVWMCTYACLKICNIHTNFGGLWRKTHTHTHTHRMHNSVNSLCLIKIW